MRPSANVFLLTHKCGNNYIEAVFDRDPTFCQYLSDDLRREMPGPYVGDMHHLNGEFINIRCRNFDPISLARLLSYIDVDSSKFFLFTRHPASLFRSAAMYHLRGGEEWSKTNKYSYLQGLSLHDALNLSGDMTKRLHVAMMHFGLAWGLPDRWIKNLKLLQLVSSKVYIVKTEELFSSIDHDYYIKLAQLMSSPFYVMHPNRLMGASPAFMGKLPAHATGQYMSDCFDGYSTDMLHFYYEHFSDVQHTFY